MEVKDGSEFLVAMKPSAMPALRGGLLAFLAAVLFGISTPLVQVFGRSLGAFMTAALLYAGAALIGALLKRRADREARIMRIGIDARPGP